MGSLEDGVFGRGWEGYAQGDTYLDKVFRLKNIFNFTHDDVVLSPSKSIKMNVLNHHLEVTRGHRLLRIRQGKRSGLRPRVQT